MGFFQAMLAQSNEQNRNTAELCVCVCDYDAAENCTFLICVFSRKTNIMKHKNYLCWTYTMLSRRQIWRSTIDPAIIWHDDNWFLMPTEIIALFQHISEITRALVWVWVWMNVYGFLYFFLDSKHFTRHYQEPSTLTRQIVCLLNGGRIHCH